jgi:methyl coenzyme M reductase subunit D
LKEKERRLEKEIEPSTLANNQETGKLLLEMNDLSGINRNNAFNRESRAERE